MLLSYDIIKEIYSYNCPGTIKYNREKLKEQFQSALYEYQILKLTSKQFSAIFSKKIEELRFYLEKAIKINYFLKKYNLYQDDYEYYTKNISRSYHVGMLTKFKYNLSAPPFLYDSLLSGCSLPYCKSSESHIDLQDVIDIIKYCPESVKYNMGYARCRNGVSPLWAISFNRNVDSNTRKQIIELLLDSGASYTDPVYVNGHPVSIKDDLRTGLRLQT